MRYQKAEKKDVPVVAALACALWPDHGYGEMQEDVSQIMEQEEAAFFLAFEDEKAVGFAQCQLRHDYVEGTDSSPVGYLEGIYVAEPYRHQGVAKQLLSACEIWAKGKGCTEFASDCELTNTESLQFHLKVGFAEANRIICFAKRI